MGSNALVGRRPGGAQPGDLEATDWIDQFNGADVLGAEQATAVARDASGDVFVGGSTNGSMFAVSAGASDIFVVRRGATSWQKQFGSSVGDAVTGIALADTDGDGVTDTVYVGGWTDGALCGYSWGSTDLFLLTLDADTGEETHCLQLGSPSEDLAYGMALDPSGEVYLAGYTGDSSFLSSDAVPDDGGICTHPIGAADGFVVRLDPSTGAQDAVCKIGVPGSAAVNAVTVGTDGGNPEIAIAGWVANSSLEYNSQDASGLCRTKDDQGKDAFVALLGPGANGGSIFDERFACQFGTPGGDAASAVAFSSDGSEVYAAGQVAPGGLPFGRTPAQSSGLCNSSGLGQADAFVMGYTAGGVGDLCEFGSALVDNAGAVGVLGPDVYASGHVGGVLPGESGGDDLYVVKDPLSSTPGWSQLATSSTEHVYAMAASADGSWLVGDTDGTLLDATSFGNLDAFLLSYDLPDLTPLHATQFGATAPANEGVDAVALGDTALWTVGWESSSLDGLTHVGRDDAFVRRYDFQGHVVGEDQFGSTAYDEARNVFVDPDSGAAYVVGDTAGDWPEDGWHHLGSSSTNDLFIRKYAADGTPVWENLFGTEGNDAVWGVYAHGDRVYVTGLTLGRFADAQLAPGNVDHGNVAAFIRMYDTAGTVLQTTEITMDGTPTTGFGVAGDDSGVYFVGNAHSPPNLGKFDVIVWRFALPTPDDPNPPLQPDPDWNVRFGGTGQDLAFAIAVAGRRIYVGGHTNGDTMAGEPNCGAANTWDAFLANIDERGQLQWLRRIGSSNDDWVFYGYGASLFATPGGAYLVGLTHGTLAGQTAHGGDDGYVVSYDKDGFFRGNYQLGTPDGDFTNGVAYRRGSLYIGGFTSGKLSDDVPDVPRGYDGFVRRMSVDELTGSPGCGP